MKKTLNFLTPKTIFLILSMVVGASAFSQTNPVLEFAAGAGNPTGNGPTVANQVITFQKNTNNPSWSSFAFVLFLNLYLLVVQYFLQIEILIKSKITLIKK